MLIINTAEYFCGGLTEAEKRQLFAEHVQWYRMYGMSMRPVPNSREEFQEYWARVCDDQLEINRATLDIFHIQIPKPKYVLMPDFLWQQIWAPARAFQNWVATGVFSSSVSAYKRARGELPPDAPLVEAPKITAPPRDRRGMPMHYVPPAVQPTSLTARAGELLHAAFSLAAPRWAVRGGLEVA